MPRTGARPADVPVIARVLETFVSKSDLMEALWDLAAERAGSDDPDAVARVVVKLLHRRAASQGRRLRVASPKRPAIGDRASQFQELAARLARIAKDEVGV